MSYQDIINQCEQYYAGLIAELGEQSVVENESNGYSQFVKWREAVRPSFDLQSSPIAYHQSTENYFQNRMLAIDEIGDWDELGPNMQPGYMGSNYNIAGSLRGIGPLNFITLANDFDESELMLAGGWNSRLFASTNAGEDWHIAGTDQQIGSHVSAADCEINSFDNSTWFLATGNGDGLFDNDQFFSSARSTGIFRSTDEGDTWEKIGDEDDLGGGTTLDPNREWQKAEVRMDPSSPPTSPHLYVAASGGIYRTTNALATDVVCEKVLGTTEILQNASYPDLVSVNASLPRPATTHKEI